MTTDGTTTTDSVLASSGLDFELATWTGSSVGDHLSSASLIDATGNVVATTGKLGENER